MNAGHRADRRQGRPAGRRTPPTRPPTRSKATATSSSRRAYEPGPKPLAMMPRFGIGAGGEPRTSRRLSWYGRGPAETYVDRQFERVGVYSSTVADQWVDYSRPQENGNKTDVRWVALTNDEGVGLLAVGAPLLSVAAAHVQQAGHRGGRLQRSSCRAVPRSTSISTCGRWAWAASTAGAAMPGRWSRTAFHRRPALRLQIPAEPGIGRLQREDPGAGEVMTGRSAASRR